MVVTEIPNIIMSTQVRHFDLYSGSRQHVRNPEEMFEMKERWENNLDEDLDCKVVG